MNPHKRKLIGWGCVSGCVVLLASAFVWVRVLHRGPPPWLMKDLRAGMAAREIKDPDERLLKYLEGRYGLLSDPANRRRVFLDFFDINHIKAMQFLVRHSPAQNRQANINAMARWVEAYRDSLTPQERTALKDQFQTGDGQAMLKRATAQYNSQDVRYRGSTAPVISQLLQTLNDVQRSP